ARPGEGVYGRPSRIAEAVVLRDLVEGLAHGVVYGRAEDLDPVEVLGLADDGVPSRHEEADEGVLDGPGGLEPGGVEMGEDVVYADEGPVDRPGHAFGEAEADEEGADEAGHGRGGDAVELSRAHAGIGQGARDDAVDPLAVLAAGYLGYDAPVFLVEGYLRRDYVGQYAGAVLDDRRGAFVA